MKPMFKKSLLPDKALMEGIVFQRFDLTTGEFSGCSHLFFDGEQLILTNITGLEDDLFSVDELLRDESGKSMAQIYQEQRSKQLSNPLTKQRRLRSKLKIKRR
jgi:hypothetical protein